MKAEYEQNGRQGPNEQPLDWARNLWNTKFLNVPAIQFHVDLLVYERLFNAYPLHGVIELGAAAGGLSLYFLLQCLQREWPLFATFDRVWPGACDTPLGQLLDMPSYCHIGDLWGGMQSEVIGLLQNADHPIMLLCDNGAKPREFQTFVPHTRRGDVIAVHDWNI